MDQQILSPLESDLPIAWASPLKMMTCLECSMPGVYENIIHTVPSMWICFFFNSVKDIIYVFCLFFTNYFKGTQFIS